MSLIQLKGIVKTYGIGDSFTYALKEVFVEINKGEMVAIMGPSGSGKSTLLHIIGCLDNYTKGEYILDGKNVSNISKRELARIRNEKIGFVFQQFALIQGYTVLENVEMPLVYSNIFRNPFQKISSKKIRKHAIEIITSVGLDHHKKKYPSQLSGGQQQRVAIARALVNDPEVIIADEPTGALDQNTGNEIMNIFKEINNNGRTVIIVTHDHKVASHCKRVITLTDGLIIEDKRVNISV